MNDVRFEDAARALRRFGSGGPTAARAVSARRRTLAALTRSPRRRMRRVITGCVVALFGATAWAQVSTWHARPVSSGVAIPSRVPPPSGSEVARQVEPTRAPELPPLSAATPDPAPVPVPAARAPSETVLYRRAHRLHFDEAPADRVIAAWNTYLRAYPHGMFAPEARYNRAISLVRAQRFRDALAALEPIACQPDGAYRRAEARTLVQRVLQQAPELAAPSCRREGR